MRELSETKNNPSAQGIGNPSARTIGKLNPIDKLVAN